MRPFQYVRAKGVDDAVLAMRGGAKCLAGGTNLVDLMKGDIEQPRVLVDIRRLPLARLSEGARPKVDQALRAAGLMDAHGGASTVRESAS